MYTQLLQQLLQRMEKLETDILRSKESEHQDTIDRDRKEQPRRAPIDGR